MKKWFNLVRKEGENKLIVNIYDVIDSFWGQSAKDFVTDISAHSGIDEIHVHINSPGGSVFDGLAIFNFLRAHAASVTTYVDGLAASIASIIALAGEKLVMPENAYLMIHEPWTYTSGNASELLKDVELLTKLTDSLANIYSERCGKDVEEIKTLMAAETWQTGKEAKEYGFATETTAPEKIAAKYRMTDNFRNVPEAVKAMLEKKPEEPEKQEVPAPPEANEPETPDIQAECVKLFAAYHEAFGTEKASEYVLAGLDMAAAKERFTAHLKSENDRLKSEAEERAANGRSLPLSGVSGHAALPPDPAGDEATAGTLWKQYNAITDPGEKTRFWNEHTEELRAEQHELSALKK
jgi:ATP-dependent Clp endopeptidase proteolytic subunit ClpP